MVTGGRHPNMRLKRERELRGWSQQELADHIGATLLSVSRWERGETVPTPVYRHLLCDLFECNAVALGFVAPATDEQPWVATTSEGEEVADPAGISWKMPHAWTPAPLGDGLIGRARVLEDVVSRLAQAETTLSVTLTGLPGVGKSALASASAHSAAARARFPDGLLWAPLGPAPDLRAQLLTWGQALGLHAAGLERHASLRVAADAVHERIGRRHLLIVLDDVWEAESALALKIGGPHCAYLVTTRLPVLASQLGESTRVHVAELDERDSLTLLRHLAPSLSEMQQDTLQQVIADVGGLPLGLTIIGNYLRIAGAAQQPRRLQAALQRLRLVHERLTLSEPRSWNERPPHLPENVPVSLQAVILSSVARLSAPARDALYALAHFPPKPQTFTEAMALAATHARLEVLDDLLDAGLLEMSASGAYQLHQTIADFARLAQTRHSTST